MASPVPAPVLDPRNGDQVAASAIGALPPELSDRSDSNPAVVIIEACAYVLDKLLFQINNWPAAVMQKLLAMIGMPQNPANAATTSQSFTLSNPQQQDSIVQKGTQFSTTDGTIVFATLADLTIRAYTTPAGTIALTAGSTTVTGTGTTFITDGTWNGWQIQIASGTWYTIASVGSTTSLTLTTSALTTTSGAFNVGAVTGAVLAQATVPGLITNVAAATLTTMVSSVANVSSTTNNAAAAGGNDLESIASAIARLPLAFSSRDVACGPSDYATFAQGVLGQNARAISRGGYNISTATQGYVTLAALSPLWTTSTTASAQEIAAVQRDQNGRVQSGVTVVNLAPVITSFTPAVALYRKSTTDAVAAKTATAGALNTYLSPNSYPWDPVRYASGTTSNAKTGQRPIWRMDLVGVVEALAGVDRVHVINGVPAIGTAWSTAPASITFTNNSTTATTSSTTGFVANQTFLVDSINSVVYLVVSLVVNTSVTLDRVFAGSTITTTPNYFNSADTDMTDWYYLPYSNLSTNPAAPPTSVVVVGSV